MKKTTINGKEYYYKMTISACKKFKEQFKVNITRADSTDVEQLTWTLFLGLEAGTKMENVEFDLKIEDFDNYDISELCEKLLDVNDVEDPKK
jgi:hypothetical protein